MNRPALILPLALCLLACELAPPAVAAPDAGYAPTGDGGPASPIPDAGDDRVASGATALSVASWNLEQFPRHPRTIERVAALIEEHQLDLIGIQEITEPEPFEALANALPDHDMYVSFDSRAFTRVGFLYRRDRIRVGEVDRIFRDERSAFPRSPLVADLEVLNDAGEVVFDFTFAVVHLKAQLDEESRQRRIAAVQLLDGWIQERVAEDPDVVVVGDWNDKLTDAPEWNVFAPFLDAPERYRFLTLSSELAGAHTYIPFEAMIDHVLVTSDALDEYGAGTTEVLAIDAVMPSYRDEVSDHRPVVSHFLIRP